MSMSIIAAIIAVGTFLFRSKEARQDQQVILRRFMIWGFEKMRCDGIAGELKEANELDRRRRKAESEAEITKSQKVIDKALDILEKRQDKQEPKRAAILDRIASTIRQIKSPSARAEAIGKVNQDRDLNAQDAAEHVRQAEAAILKAGGRIKIAPEVREAIQRWMDPKGERQGPGTPKPEAAELPPTPEVKTTVKRKPQSKGGPKDKKPQ